MQFSITPREKRFKKIQATVDSLTPVSPSWPLETLGVGKALGGKRKNEKGECSPVFFYGC